MLFDTLQVPESLLVAQQECRLVVFAGAGVSYEKPSGLPGFLDLTKQIAQRPLKQREMLRLDQFLGELKEEGMDVHAEAARDAEAEAYATMLNAALREAGIDSGECSGIDYDPRPEGVVVICHDLQSPSPLPMCLLGGLRAAGVEAELSQAPGWAVTNPNWAGIWVGIKRCS